MRYLLFISGLFTICFIVAAMGFTDPAENKPEPNLLYIRKESSAFALSAQQLYTAISRVDNSKPLTVRWAVAALKNCRIRYKKISFFLNYFFPQVALQLNAPAKYEVEEPYREFEEPRGLQQIEALLFMPHPEKKKAALLNLAFILKESAADLNSLYYSFSATDGQWMESIHLELIRIMTLYITGYDAPFMKSGIVESSIAMESLLITLNSRMPNAKAGAQLKMEFRRTINYLNADSRFNHFNRLIFLTDHALPLEQQLTSFIKTNGWQISTVRHLNYNARNLFASEVVTGLPSADTGLIARGRKLFFETRLSGNNSRSCASCHQPGKYFTDGLAHNSKLNGSGNLKRNTPSLLYAAYQSAQFWDGRAATLETQVHDVLLNPDEMNSSMETNSLSLSEMEPALAAFLCTLAPFNSAFDRFMAGDKHAMNSDQQLGFNLFMGKAKCATCHFAPLFNGSTPPFFNRTEFEVLGVPRGDDFTKPILDSDAGRYDIFPSLYYQYAFKTPTVRNTGKTGPYMHNGQFSSLKKLIVFYNRGGGAGLGLTVSSQTLDSSPLHLTKREINCVISFLNALTDRL